MRPLIRKEEKDTFKLVKCKKYMDSFIGKSITGCTFQTCDLSYHYRQSFGHCSCFKVDWITWITKKDRLVLYDK